MWPWKKRRQPGSDAPSVIGADMRVVGRIESTGDLTILGRVEGDIVHNGRLVIGPGGHCVSHIQAVEMQVAGEVHGNLQVQSTLELLSSARVYGDTACAALQIQQGATFSGTNHMGAAPPLLQAPAALPAPASPAMAILLEPVGAEEREVLGSGAVPDQEARPPAAVPVARAAAQGAGTVEAVAFSGGFAAALRATDS